MSDQLEQEAGESGILVGERLRAAREVLGMTAQEIAERLHLGLRQVELLEDGELSRLPGKTFIRGVVRSYAALVRLDPVPLLALLDRSRELAAPTLCVRESTRVVMTESAQPSFLRERRSVLGPVLVVLLVLCALAALIFVALRLDLNTLSSSVRNAHETTNPELTPTPLPLPASVLTPNPQPAPVDAHATANAPAATAPAVVAPAPPTRAEQKPRPTPPAAADLAARNDVASRTLRFDFSGTAWIQVRGHDNKILISGQFSQGQTRTLTGRPPFFVTVGDVNQVRLFDNNREVPLKSSSPNSRTMRLKLP